MTDNERELKLQAFFDGELPEAEAREVAAWIAGDSAAADLHRELRNTRQALSGFERGVKLPEAREFYWSKIAREIEHIEREEPARPWVSPLVWLRRMLLPLGGLAVIAAAGLLSWHPSPAFAEPEVETASNDCQAMTYRDQQEGMTLVWFSFNGDNSQGDKSADGKAQ